MLRGVLDVVVPMAPTLVREPFHRDGWVYEEKIDGWRILAYKAGDRVCLVSRNGRDPTSASPTWPPRSESCPLARWCLTAR
jgi:ATP-dependent DNA ligase